jgi:N-acetylglucosaminyldiphosphoundecaprenol N-acetyl-beta-D-mannosaminyltransferase
MTTARFQIGRVPLDSVTLTGAIDTIVELAQAGRGGTVYTPNVDHVVVADHDDAFSAAYADVSLSLVDGVPVLWGGRLLGFDIPEKVSGSDLFEPLVERAAQLRLPIYLLGGGPGVGELARAELCRRYPGLVVVGLSAPRIDSKGNAENEAALIEEIRAAKPALVFVACGAPKSELFSHRVRPLVDSAVFVCVGAAIDFAAGTARRAPRWVSSVGLEWAYRLVREPRRLASRYLLRDPKFFWILAKQFMAPASRSVLPARPVATAAPLSEGVPPMSHVRQTGAAAEAETAPVSHVTGDREPTEKVGTSRG